MKLELDPGTKHFPILQKVAMLPVPLHLQHRVVTEIMEKMQ